MPSKSPKAIRPCRECGTDVALWIARDFERKWFCSQQCRSRFFGRSKDMTVMWAKNHTPEVNVRKGRKGELHPNWMPLGSRSLSSHGYVKVKTERGWEYEHRVIVGAEPGQVVHHENEDKTDNRPENLIPMANVEHLEMHRRKRYAFG
jgi:hypothetical protein